MTETEKKTLLNKSMKARTVWALCRRLTKSKAKTRQHNTKRC